MKHSEVTKQKISESQKDRAKALETRKKMSESQRGKNNSFYGKNHTELTKSKISQIKGTLIYVHTVNLELMCSFPSSKAAAEHFKTNTTATQFEICTIKSYI